MRITLGQLRAIIQEAGDFPTWDELPKREQLLSTYSDVYKEKYGIRPRGMMQRMQDWTDDEIEAELNRLFDVPDQDDDWEPEPSVHDYPPSEAEVTPEEMKGVHSMEAMPTRSGMGRRR